MATEAWVQHGSVSEIDNVGLAAASAAVFNAGAQVINSSGTVTQMTAANTDSTFIGIAGGTTVSGNTDDIIVHRKCIVNATLVTGSWTFGGGAKGYGNSDIYTFELDGGAETIGWFNTVDVTTVRGDILIDVIALGKFFGVDA